MYLKSLTLRGFKSFASSTTLNFEPGIVCVVGPNGSGKSNVVDALAWVMGEQGAKSLRGGKMEDVIFAGTAGRAPLGRAEVLLTIDNSDGALPIEYSEVTISRTMFRNGGSEYAINGTPCRLLDVQELLSDSGIGREMHVIVGQGQLDSVLRATPEERRGFIEEAAGVLKHRKRKEKALRKLESTDGNLTRLQDVLTELRRQLKPLGRQAEVARRAAVIQADARDARARLLADDIVTARSVIAEELADETALKERRAKVERRSCRSPSGRDRTRGVAAHATRRASPPPRRPGSHCLACANGCAAPPAWRPSACGRPPSRPTTGGCGRDPAELEAEAGRVQEQLERMAASVAEATAGLEQRRRRSATRPRPPTPGGATRRRPAPCRRRPARGTRPPARPGQRHPQPGRRRRRRDRPAHRGPRRGRRGARPRPSTRSPPRRTRSPGSTPVSPVSTPSWRRPKRALGASTTGSAGLGRDMHAAERRQAGLSARKEALELGLAPQTAPAPCWPPATRSAACSARSPRC